MQSLERLGPEEVAARIASNVYLGGDRGLAEAWMARRREAAGAEQLQLSRGATVAAQSANKIAVAALIVAALSRVVSAVAIFKA